MKRLAADLEHVSSVAADVWERLRGQTLLITGATGFFGRWLLETFVHANAKLDLGSYAVAVSRHPTRLQAQAPHLSDRRCVTFVAADVRELSLQDLPRERRDIGVVIHAASEASTTLNAEDPLTMFDVVVRGTRAVLELARETGARRFLLASSGAVYGPQPTNLAHIPEEYAGGPDCTLPQAAYAEGKRAAEAMCACYAQKYSLQCVIGRCFGFVGPFLPLDAHFAIGNFIRDALDGRPIQVLGDGTPVRSYLYAADLAVWLWKLLINGGNCRAYNVGSEDARSLRDVAEVVAQVAGSPGVQVCGKPNPAASAQRHVPSCARARKELGLTAWVPLEDAISRTLRYHRTAAQR